MQDSHSPPATLHGELPTQMLAMLGIGRGIDLSGAEKAVRDLLLALGVDPLDETFRDTPARVARGYAELLSPPPFQLRTFPNNEGYHQMVVATAIPFHSLCKHHLLPFTGEAHVAYIPRDRILGLSKLARVIEMFARRLQLQEEMTVQVTTWLQASLKPEGVGVILEAQHSCISLRGVKQRGQQIRTFSFDGVMRDDPTLRHEFLSSAGIPG